VLRNVQHFLQKTFLKKIHQWRSLGASFSRASSLGDCCGIRIYPETFLFVYARQKEDKMELLSCDLVPYKTLEDIKNFLSTMVVDFDLKNTTCHWILQSEQYQLMPLDALPVPSNEFQSAIRWKIKNLLPFPVEDAIIDSFPIPLDKSPAAREQIMTVIARASMLTPFCDAIQESGLNLTTIDIPELCLRNLLNADTTELKNFALLYIRHTNSQLLISNQESLYVARQIDLDLKNLELLIHKPEQSEELHQSIDKVLLELLRSFDYFQYNWRQASPSQLFWVGGSGGNLKPLLTLLGQRLNIPVSRLDISPYFTFDPEKFVSIKQIPEGTLFPLLGGMLKERIFAHATEH